MRAGASAPRAKERENVEKVRRLYPGTFDLVVALDDPRALDAVRTLFEPLADPDFETVTVPGQVPLTGAGAEDPSQPIFHGLEGFVSAFREWLTAWESWVATATEIIDADENRVLVLLDIKARSKTHQVEMPIEAANLWTLRDGRLARLELFFDQAEALEAAGLRE